MRVLVVILLVLSFPVLEAWLLFELGERFGVWVVVWLVAAAIVGLMLIRLERLVWAIRLAGSLRDDGPLSETITDMNRAQDEYARVLAGADLVLILSSMLHGIAVGNMLPSSVRTICVDINPAVVTKLADRGTAHALGLVTDVGLFLHLLAQELGLDPGP